MLTPLVYTTNSWADMLAAAAPDLPTARLLAWIAEESGGNPCALGTRYEVGIFQIDMQDGPVAGGSVDTLHGNFAAGPTSQVRARSLTADEEALQVSTGVTYVRSCLARAQQAAPTWEGADLWSLTKMCHALPAIVSQLLPQAAAAGHASSWADFKGYALGCQRSQLPTVLQRYAPLDRFFANAGRVGGADGAAPQDGGFSLPGIGALDLVSALALAALIALTIYLR